MSALGIAGFTVLTFLIGYRFYATYLADRLFGLSDESQGQPPSVEMRDDIDYVPTKKGILFGHHFSSIAGAAPIVGPAVAVIWGWLPAIIWIILGVLFMGAAHDFGALVVSMRNKGQSVAQVAEKVLGPNARTMFLLVIFFLVWMVIAVFALIIANLFISFPSSVLPVNFEIIIALVMGLLINKKNISLTIPSLLAQAGLFIMIYLGTQYPISLRPLFGDSELMVWIVFLLIYSMIASVLPVWLLLQPRDYINSHQLFLGLFLMFAGLIVTNPPMIAPAINPNPVGAPPIFPFLFITIACGAISGFHGLVSSGTTSKQVATWKDAKPIGYGSMMGEGLLAMLATLATCTGFQSTAAWHSHYSSWGAASGLTAKINAFVLGAGKFVTGLGINESFAQTVIAVLIISFAATSLDTACRIQRYIIHEVGESFGVPVLKNRYLGSFLAVLTAFILMMTKGGGKGGLFIWPLFGSTNQMLAGLTLLMVSIFLLKMGKKTLNYLIPATIIVFITGISLMMNLKIYWSKGQWMLFIIGVILFLCQIWVFISTLTIFKNHRKSN